MNRWIDEVTERRAVFAERERYQKLLSRLERRRQELELQDNAVRCAIDALDKRLAKLG